MFHIYRRDIIVDVFLNGGVFPPEGSSSVNVLVQVASRCRDERRNVFSGASRLYLVFRT